jgi:hypothetical protein
VEALAANHFDEVTLIHLAGTEAGSKNGSEPARPRPASTPPCRAGTRTVSQATVIAHGRNGQHIVANPLSRRPATWIMAAFAAMAGAITVPLGEAVTLAAPRRRPGTGGPARTYCRRPDGPA